MDLSIDGLLFIKNREGFRARKYLDIRGVPTIGYGSTGPFIPDVITEQEAQGLVLKHIKPINLVLNTLVLRQNQFDALVSFIYNIGLEAFQHSTMLKLLRQKKYQKAAQEFDRWIYINKTPNQGLKNRRALEKTLFLNGVYG